MENYLINGADDTGDVGEGETVLVDLLGVIVKQGAVEAFGGTVNDGSPGSGNLTHKTIYFL